MKSEGMVYLVGAGPGDPGLFTLRGAELLRRAEVVIYDGLVNRELIRMAAPSAELIYGGKFDRTRCVSQDELNELLLAKAREGKRVVRLKGGDPYIFGRGGEEAEVLAQAGIPFEVVPGVSSVYSVPGAAGIPLTHRGHNSSVTLVTGHGAPSSPSNKLDWAHLAKSQGTLVVMMGLKNVREVAQVLIHHGRAESTPAAIVSRGTTHRQRSVSGTLATIADLADAAQLSPPAIFVIGETVNLRQQLNWFERRPLFGKRVVVTQRADLAARQVSILRELGAEVLQVPATRWTAHPEQGPLDQAMDALKSYDWILFSNPVSVDFFLQKVIDRHGDLRELAGIRLGAYGPRTGEKVRQWHLKPSAVAADHKVPLIMDVITQADSVRGKNFLVLRGDLALENVPDALRAMGARVEVVSGYSVEPEVDSNGDAAEWLANGADWVIFASALAIEHVHHRYDLPSVIQRFPATRLAIASPGIQGALQKFGLEPTIISEPDNPELLANQIAALANQAAAK